MDSGIVSSSTEPAWPVLDSRRRLVHLTDADESYSQIAAARRQIGIDDWDLGNRIGPLGSGKVKQGRAINHSETGANAGLSDFLYT